LKMKKPSSLRLIVNACPRCGGTAYLEDPYEDDWRCLQCARSVPSPLAVRGRPTAA
jgi:hypothetical protein